MRIATFGKFNVPHSGHKALLHSMSTNYANITEIIVGFSSSNKNNRYVISRISDFRAVCGNNVTFSSCICPNLWTYCKMLNDEPTILCLGSDRIAQTQRLINSAQFKNINLREINRTSNSASSTKLRCLYKTARGNFEVFNELALINAYCVSRLTAKIAYDAIKQELIDVK